MSNKISYTYKEYSDESKFTSSGSRIQLKEYEDNLVFLHHCTSEKADYAFYNASPSGDDPVIYDHGYFDSCLKVSSPLKFDYENFESLNKTGTISFYTGINSLTGYCTHSLLGSSFPAEGLYAGDYSLTIKVGTEAAKILVFTVESDGATLSNIRDLLTFNVDPTIYYCSVDVDDLTNITFKSFQQGKLVTISDGTEGNNLLDYIKLGEQSYSSYPSEDVSIFTIGRESDNISKIDFKHINKSNKSYIDAIIYDNSGNIASTLETYWNNSGITLDNIELDFNEELAYLFLNGELKDVQKTGFTRANNSSYLTLNGLSSSAYSFDEIIISSAVKNTKSFSPRSTSLTKYDTTNPYIDFTFSGDDVGSKTTNTLTVDASSNISMTVMFNGYPYYYQSGSWRKGDSTFSCSNDYYTFMDKLSSFPFDGSDFKIRAWFSSDGSTLAYIDDIFFSTEDTVLINSTGDAAAVLIGKREIGDDGINFYGNWNQTNVVNCSFTDIKKIKDKNIYLACSNENEGVWYSSDGKVFAKTSLTAGKFVFSDEANGYVFVVSDDSSIYYSDDAINWKKSTLSDDSSEAVNSISYANGKYFISKENSGMWCGDDPSSFARTKLLNGSFTKVLYGGSNDANDGAYYCYGNSKFFKVISTDGISWESNQNYPEATKLKTVNNITYYLNSSIGSENNNGLYYSTDGGSTIVQTSITDANIATYDVCYCFGTYFMATSAGLFTSLNGIVFVQKNAVVFNNLSYGNGILCLSKITDSDSAVDDGLAYYSDDGISIYQGKKSKTNAFYNITGEDPLYAAGSSLHEGIFYSGMKLTITTDKGSTDIYFDSKNYSLDEILKAIRDADPEGISKVYADSTGKVYLVSSTLGKDAYITVSEPAAPLIFGDVSTVSGTSSETATDYSEIYSDIKSLYGAPLMTFEITQHQLDLFIKEAVDLYNKYRSDDVSTVQLQLKGNAKDGYEIPSIVGGDQRKIIDIVFKPIFPLSFYGTDLIGNEGDGENIISLMLAKSIFGGMGMGGVSSGFTEDYYMANMSITDLKQTLGINPTWDVFNDRLYIYPAGVSRYTNVCIKYRSAIEFKKACHDKEFLQYVVGKCYQLVGNIRGAYGGSLTTGIGSINMNADNLFDRGKQMCDDAVEFWKKNDTPLAFIMG